jgi:hypothetical protein
MTPAISLECTARAEGATLRVAYRVRNGERTDVGVFHRLPAVRLDGAHDLHPSCAYVALESGTLVLRKAVLVPPPGMHVNATQVPLAAKLAPGQTLAEEMVLPVPVPVCHPFVRAVLAAGAPSGGDVVARRPVTAAAVRFEIGVFTAAGDAPTQFLPVSPAFPDVFRPWPPGPAVAGQVILHQTVPVQVQVLDYEVVPPAK